MAKIITVACWGSMQEDVNVDDSYHSVGSEHHECINEVVVSEER